jgi:ABC-type hemin transport system ATPase subunit
MEKLEINELGEVFLAILPYFKNRVIFVDDAVQDMGLYHICRMNDIMLALAESGAVVLYLVLDDLSQIRGFSDPEFMSQTGPADMDMDRIDNWSQMMTNAKGYLPQIKPGKPV